MQLSGTGLISRFAEMPYLLSAIIFLEDHEAYLLTAMRQRRNLIHCILMLSAIR